MVVVTIDSGTTNTRVRVWMDNTVIADTHENVGVRDTAITGSKATLSTGVKKALDNALSEAGIKESDPMIVIASGMITSNVGLCEVPHLISPAGLAELSKGIVKKIIPEISAHPIWFIPGIKSNVPEVTIDNCETMDIMRGEETETIGVLSTLDIKGPALIVLPGSHSKFIKVDENNKIVGSATTIAGELLDVITQKTILAGSLEHKFADRLEDEYLLKGATFCQDFGLARACFLIRIQDLFSGLTINQRANFLLGIVLCSDMLTIKKSRSLNIERDTTIIISGKEILRDAIYTLIQNDAFFIGRIIVNKERKDKPLSGLGAIAIAHEVNLL